MIEWTHWHNEPILIGGLIFLGWLYAILAGPWRERLAPGQPYPRRQAIAFYSALVIFYLAVVHALRMPIGLGDLAVIVPISLVIQLLPVSINGFGVREAAFAFYFNRLGLPIQSALLLSLVSTALTMLFSLSGAAVYVTRGR